jgi:hypothetical protein
MNKSPMFYCEDTNAFYDSRIHAVIPEHAQNLTSKEYLAKLDELSAGQSIPDANNELSLREFEANNQISIIKPAVDGGYAKPEHTQLLADWQRYRYELTLVPEQPGWPESPQWPTEPDKVI